jgi:hypothetical protein
MLNTLAGIIASSGGAAAGDYQSIATVTVGSGGSSTVSFTSIPSTYTHLQLRVLAQTNRGTYGRDAVKLNLNSDTGNNYAWHELFGDGSSAATNAASTTNRGEAAEVGTTTGGAFGAAVIDFLDYANTSKYKTVRSLFGGDHNGTIAGFGGTVGLYSTLWQSTSAISTITFAPVNGTLFSQYSSFALYGIKG